MIPGDSLSAGLGRNGLVGKTGGPDEGGNVIPSADTSPPPRDLPRRPGQSIGEASLRTFPLAAATRPSFWSSRQQSPWPPAWAITRTFSCRFSSTSRRRMGSSADDIFRTSVFLRHTSPSAGGTAHRRERRASDDVMTVPHPTPPLSDRGARPVRRFPSLGLDPTS